MNMKRPSWIRTIIADPDVTSSGATAESTEPVENNHASELQDEQSDKPDEDSDSDEDPKARGSKTMVLKDLARERDKRQATEAERDELKAKLEQYQRAQMTEQEKAIADRDAARARIAELEKQIADEHAAATRREAVEKALSATKLPAEMADRLRGETAEEIMEDAKTLAQTIGFDRLAVDPTQGHNAAGKTHTNSLSSALRAHFNL